jgi:SRSO17 transposase
MVLIRRIDMDITQIKGIGKELNTFLSQFDDCFARIGSRRNLRAYVHGQLSDLPRKSIEPMALAADLPPRTLQCFLSLLEWDHLRLRDKLQWKVAADHAHPAAIGLIDDTGNPKKGRETAGVQWQWCGNTGKTDNCVVGVHTGYVAGDFQCLLDSDVYLPEGWASDPARRKKADIPEEVVYRKKTDIALDQVSRALQNGIRVSAWTFDAWYGRDGEFLDGLETRGQNYVGEVPSDFCGWLYEPEILVRPTARERHRRGRKRHFPRLSKKALPASEVRNLLVYSRVFQNQTWEPFHIKDSENGPIVWEVKHARFYRKQGEDGLPGPAHYLIIARNVLNPQEIKYFVSNLLPGPNDITLEKLLWIAFSRFPIERCFEIGKRELGMDHFEVRNWTAIHRHFYISQLSYLFCSRVHQKLREKNDRGFLFDRRTGAASGQYVDQGTIPTAARPHKALSPHGQCDCVLSKTQPRRSDIAYQRNACQAPTVKHKRKTIEVMCTQ